MKRHPTDTVSLVFGLIFAAIAGWWLVATLVDGRASVPVAWLAVGTLIVIGTVGLVSSVLRKPPAGATADPDPAVGPAGTAPTVPLAADTTVAPADPTPRDPTPRDAASTGADTDRGARP